MRTFFFFAFCVLFAACQPEDRPSVSLPTENHLEGDTALRIDRYLTALAGQGYSSTAFVAIGDRIILSKGYGLADDERQLPVTPATVFGIGSITKQFTGAAILKLDMLGKLSVEDPINNYFSNVPPDKQGITLHHLLTHSAGFPGAIGDDYAPTGREAFIELALGTPLQFVPGSDYGYSNVGYSLLAAIIEQVSGQSYESFLRENLFLPAGMKQTGYVLPGWKPQQVATGYRRGEPWGKLHEKNWAEDGPYWHLRGNGGILSTPGDMYRWHRALLGEEILSDAAKKKYYARHVEEGEGAGTYYGYGWAIFPTPRGTDLITHNGGNGVFFADVLRYVEEGVFIFFATNRSRRNANNAGFEMARMIFQSDYEPEAPSLQGVERSALPADERGPTTEALLATIQSGTEESIRGFFEQYVSPGLTGLAPIEQHISIFRQLHTDLQGAELTRIVENDRRLELTLNHPEKGEAWLLIVEFSPLEPGKMAGLGIEAE